MDFNSITVLTDTKFYFHRANALVPLNGCEWGVEIIGALPVLYGVK